jgi:predicted metal-dependent peptidase
MNEIKTKLARARTKLIMDKPFLGALVLRLKTQPAQEWCVTCATDARSFYYNPSYLKALNINQVQFVLAHEALHCALSHFARREHRNKHRWDLACDYAINPLLVADGLTPPPGVWIPECYEDMIAEEIYPMIEENNANEPMDRHVYDDDQQKQPDGNNSNPPNGEHQKDQENYRSPQNDSSFAEEEVEINSGNAPQPPPLTNTECQNLDVQWQQRLAGAMQQALQSGKLSGALARMVDHLLQPQLPWRMLLARHMTTTARKDYSDTRPSRREGTAIFPSQHSAQLEVVVALDISASVSDDEMAQFLAEINALKGQIRARVTLLACDAQLSQESPWIYEPWEELKTSHELTGGGGTSFKPIFDYVDLEMQPPDLLLYFTDAEGDFPKTVPTYPVLWLVKGSLQVPWGQRIQLN